MLLSAEGFSGVEIAERVGCSEPTVICWRNRYAQRGLARLDDRPREGHARSMSPAQRWESDYTRHGTTSLFAALEVATRKVVDACYTRHRHQEFVKFLRQVAKAYPLVTLHIVCDNYATHKHENVQKWLRRQAHHVALHADLGQLAESGRGVLHRHHSPGDPPWQLRFRR